MNFFYRHCGFEVGAIFMIYVIINLPSVLTKEVNFGESVTLTCVFKNDTKSAIWLKNNTTIRNHVVREEGILLILNNVDTTDTGVYSCNDITNGLPGEELTLYNISVKEDKRLRFINFKKMELHRTVLFPSGEDQTFICYASGEGPILYKWFKDNKLLLSRKVDSTLVVDQPTLKLNTLVVSDSATYTCRAQNKNGYIGFNYTLVVQDLARTVPYLDKSESKNQTRFIGENTTIACYELISGKIPDFRWLKWKGAFNKTILKRVVDSDLSEVDHNYLKVLNVDLFKKTSIFRGGINEQKKIIYGVELTLRNLTIEDTGYYTCIASNHIGSDNANMFLKVLPKDPIVVANTKTATTKTTVKKKTLVIIVVLVSTFIVIMFAIIFLTYKWMKAGRQEKKNVLILHSHDDEDGL